MKEWQSGHCVAPGLARDPRLPEARASELRLNADCGITRVTRLLLVPMPNSQSSVGPLRGLDVTHAEHWR